MATNTGKFKVTVLFAHAKTTKGAEAWAEVNANGDPVLSDEEGKVVGALYMRKTGLKGARPQNLKVTIEEID